MLRNGIVVSSIVEVILNDHLSIRIVLHKCYLIDYPCAISCTTFSTWNRKEAFKLYP